MTDATHTPGPWFAIHYPSEGASAGPAISVVQGPEIIYRDKYSGFNAADANLIAAAPDLLAFAEEVRRRCIEMGMPGHELCTLAEAAIAKAVQP